jgi:hypothetical protein
MSLILDGTNGLSDVDGTAATPAIRGTDTNTGIFFPAADTIAFAEGGTEVARFDSSGRLGIGTSSPNASLDVNGAIKFGSISGGIAYIGGLTRVANAANGTVSYTGVGFRPSVVYFMAETPSVFLGWGFSTATSQRAVSVEGGASVGTITTGGIYVTAGAATQTLIGNLTSMDADGFTISWTRSGLGPSTVNVSYMAFR